MKTHQNKSSFIDQEMKEMEVMPTTRIARNEFQLHNGHSLSKLDNIANNLDNTNKNLSHIFSSFLSIISLLIAIIMIIFFSTNGIIQYFFGLGVKSEHAIPGLAIDSNTTPINFMDINKK